MNRKLKARIIEEFGSQSDFAQAMQVDEAVVSRVVNGRRILSHEDAVKWSRVLNCDPSILEQRQ